jgi:hypothetical protein
MHVVDFIKHYEAHDEDELYRVEQFHLDLSNTLKHFVADQKQLSKELCVTFRINDLTLINFMKWLEDKGNE